jgi:colicin import membrane protein
MPKMMKSKAEEKYFASQRKDQQALKERDKARQEIAERVAKLKALRLAKEAADKKAAQEAAAEKAAAKRAAPVPPQASRRQS